MLEASHNRIPRALGKQKQQSRLSVSRARIHSRCYLWGKVFRGSFRGSPPKNVCLIQKARDRGSPFVFVKVRSGGSANLEDINSDHLNVSLFSSIRRTVYS